MVRRALLACACALLGACSFSGFNRPVAVPPPQEETTLSGVRYVELAEGKGTPAVYGSLVRIHYIGWVGGERFDSSWDRGNPVAFTIGKAEVMKGLEDGVIGARVGGKRRLTIPPELGFGEQGVAGVVPPNAELVFELEVVEVVGP
ncbi:MAG: FKBP-type peptidyl-prolyl cis-trans isomerase [Planctomycetes bacterium]|nr:FKBP-type peptidyl-prolyl cis-trans isomerase [Planctomycetota bacterium]